MANQNTDKVTEAIVRMYRMGTGDCFAIKFMAGEKVRFTMLIDCGACTGSEPRLAPYIKDLKKFLSNNHPQSKVKLDLLVVTHEHEDHVLGFDRCSDLFLNNFETDRIWMSWAEDDDDDEIKEWKKKYGDVKKAAAKAAEKLKLAVNTPQFRKNFEGNRYGMEAKTARENFINTLNDLTNLDVNRKDVKGNYVGGLEGMEVVKKKIKRNSDISYLSPGKIDTDTLGSAGVKFYVLGPPKGWEELNVEHGEDEEDIYAHSENNKIPDGDAFSAAVNSNGADVTNLSPFDDRYFMTEEEVKENKYFKDEWRKIDYDWLYSAGALALRINAITNNLSLALAIEFEDSGKVMLFPGDAEYASWASWHRVNWKKKGKDGKHLTEDLLNRTVFYKVAHHLSHNGTARKKGLDMMGNEHFVAMAPLDYDIIRKGWNTTMPNRLLVTALLDETRGRLMIMNENGLFADAAKKVKIGKAITKARTKLTDSERRAFKDNYVINDLYMQYKVKV